MTNPCMLTRSLRRRSSMAWPTVRSWNVTTCMESPEAPCVHARATGTGSATLVTGGAGRHALAVRDASAACHGRPRGPRALHTAVRVLAAGDACPGLGWCLIFLAADPCCLAMVVNRLVMQVAHTPPLTCPCVRTRSLKGTGLGASPLAALARSRHTVMPARQLRRAWSSRGGVLCTHWWCICAQGCGMITSSMCMALLPWSADAVVLSSLASALVACRMRPRRSHLRARGRGRECAGRERSTPHSVDHPRAARGTLTQS